MGMSALFSLAEVVYPPASASAQALSNSVVFNMAFTRRKSGTGGLAQSETVRLGTTGIEIGKGQRR
jgi:hypothetical protein